MALSPEQIARAVEVMQEYLNALPNTDGKTPSELSAILDKDRAEMIDDQLKPLVSAYLAGNVPLDEFKRKVDGINKKHNYWGFKGPKGQMFFNLLVNTAPNASDCDHELKAAIVTPTNEDMARNRITRFANQVRGVGEAHVKAGGTKQGRPNIGSVPFFLSYFWQLQDRQQWPVYHTNGVKTMIDLNLWQLSEDLAEDYISFKHLYEELSGVFSKESGIPFDLYGVEHVFWFKGRNPYAGLKLLRPKENIGAENQITITTDNSPTLAILPDSYVPPIVALLPEMSRNEPGFDAVAKASGLSLSKAFEKSVHAAFTILGYDTKLLGQGKGRVPDGLALEPDGSYGIIWDAKIRESGYRMGTDDRTIREYINAQLRELKRFRAVRKTYYVLVSSNFVDEFEDLIPSIKMETDINEVCLLEADALVAMVDARLRNPLEVTLGSDAIQRLFNSSGTISVEDVMESLS